MVNAAVHNEPVAATNPEGASAANTKWRLGKIFQVEENQGRF